MISENNAFTSGNAFFADELLIPTRMFVAVTLSECASETSQQHLTFWARLESLDARELLEEKGLVPIQLWLLSGWVNFIHRGNTDLIPIQHVDRWDCL